MIANADVLAILRERIDVRKLAVGMAVGLLENGLSRIITYGRLGAADARPVLSGTPFEIGSVTKVFAALLLADMVERGELGLDDPAESHLPDGFRLPQFGGRKITLADLATHTSGLPNVPPLSGHPLLALGAFTAVALRDWLADAALDREPGTHWEYSNVGTALLGLALATRAGCSYDVLLHRRILDPLQMHRTTLDVLPAVADGAAHGHDAELMPVAAVVTGMFGPAGGLRSNVPDLLRFLAALLPGSGSPLEAAARRLVEVVRPTSRIDTGQAMGWEVFETPAGPILAKDGVTMGQASTVALDAATARAVVVLSNCLPVLRLPPPDGGIGTADLARHLLSPDLPFGMSAAAGDGHT